MKMFAEEKLSMSTQAFRDVASWLFSLTVYSSVPSSCTHTTLLSCSFFIFITRCRTTPTISPQLFPQSNYRGAHKKRRGGASEMKCVLKMAGLPLTANLHSHVCRGALKWVERPDRRRRESKMAAELHIIRLLSPDSLTLYMKQPVVFYPSHQFLFVDIQKHDWAFKYLLEDYKVWKMCLTLALNGH